MIILHGFTAGVVELKLVLVFFGVDAKGPKILTCKFSLGNGVGPAWVALARALPGMYAIKIPSRPTKISARPPHYHFLSINTHRRKTEKGKRYINKSWLWWQVSPKKPCRHGAMPSLELSVQSLQTPAFIRSTCDAPHFREQRLMVASKPACRSRRTAKRPTVAWKTMIHCITLPH